MSSVETNGSEDESISNKEITEVRKVCKQIKSDLMEFL